MQIQEISDEDKTFLEGFSETQFLSMNSTQLKSIANLPKMVKLERLELNDNKIGSSSDSLLSLIPDLYENLRVLKISNNSIKTIEEIQGLAKCPKLESLDLSNNPIVTELGEEYTAKIREMLPKLDILDGLNRDGNEVVSEDESEDDEEEGEGEDDAEDDAEEDGDEEDDGEEDPDDEEEEGDEEGDENDEEENGAADDQAGGADGVEGKLVGKKRKASEKNGAPADANGDSTEAIEGGLDATKKRVNVDPSS
eukprot:403342577